MLENINLKKKLSREASKAILPPLQQRLNDLEKACWDQQVPTMIVFEGWDAAGKGTTISALTQRLDPRGFKLYPITSPRTYEQQRPWLWRFWLKVPNRGEMVIFDKSWYGRVLEERVEKTIPEKAWRQAYRDIVEFERMLADDGATILKFFLHISKKEQKERFRAIQAGSIAIGTPLISPRHFVATCGNKFVPSMAGEANDVRVGDPKLEILVRCNGEGVFH